MSILNLNNGIFTEKKYDEYNMISLYNYEKINSLFKNFDTISFLNLIFEKNIMLNNGYNKSFRSELSFNAFFALFSIFNDRNGFDINIIHLKEIKLFKPYFIRYNRLHYRILF